MTVLKNENKAIFGVSGDDYLVPVYKVANFLKTWRVWLRMFEFDVS